MANPPDAVFASYLIRLRLLEKNLLPEFDRGVANLLDAIVKRGNELLARFEKANKSAR